MQELLYTSVPRGLKPGSRGFSTVLSTQGMVAPLAAALEALSGYRPVFPIGHARVAENPVVYSHLKLQVAGKAWYVLSRVADYGLDYSQRTNKLAHHLVLDKSELPAAGPASLLRASGIMRESWEGEPKIVPPKPMSKHPIAPSGMCQAWKEMTGDAGWAGVLAESFLKDASRPVILLFEPGQDLRPLIDESLSLLPAERRWDVTFSTYFTGSSQGITCLWRGIVLGSKEATESLRFVNALRIDLTSTDIGRAEGGELVDAARKGIRLTARPTLSPKQTASREQPEPRVVVKDNVDEPAVSRTSYEEAGTETRAAPLASHDHSQVPPRLTPSAFKFANARRQTDSDDPTARTSRGRKSVILIGVAFLLVCSISAGVFLIKKLAKDGQTKPTAALASDGTNQSSPSSGMKEGDETSSKKAAATDNQSPEGAASPEVTTNPASPGEKPEANHKPQDASATKNETQIASESKVASPKGTPHSLPDKSATKPDVAPKPTSVVATDKEKALVIFLEVFKGTPPKYELQNASYETDISATELPNSTLTLITPKESKFKKNPPGGSLLLEPPSEQPGVAIGMFKLVEKDDVLRVEFEKRQDAEASKFLRFCILRLRTKNRLIDFTFFKSQVESISPLRDGKTTFHAPELRAALDQKFVVRCEDFALRANTDDEQRMTLERKDSKDVLFIGKMSEDQCRTLSQSNGNVSVSAPKKSDKFEVVFASEPSKFVDKKTALRNDLEKLVNNSGIGFVTQWKNKDTFGWGYTNRSHGLFEDIDEAHKKWLGLNKDNKQKEKEEAANFMVEIGMLKERMKMIAADIETADKTEESLRSATIQATFVIEINQSGESAKIELLRLTGAENKKTNQ